MGFLKKLFGRGSNTTYLTEPEMEGITQHFAKFVGETENVFHELVSDAVHIDVHFIPEVPGKDIRVLYTTGMSALPMPGLGPDEAFAEIVLILPKSWPIEMDKLAEERYFWPIRSLKVMARIPTDHGVPVRMGLSMPNGDPAEPFPGTTFLGIMLARPDMFGSGFTPATIDGKVINFFVIAPVTAQEMDWKIQQESATALLARYFELGIDPMKIALIDPDRASFI